MERESKEFMIINGTIIVIGFAVPAVLYLLWTLAFSLPWITYLFLSFGGAFFYLFIKPTQTEIDEGKWYNRDRTKFCEPVQVHKPTSIKEVIDIVTAACRSNRKIKVVGRGNSYSSIGLTTIGGEIMSLENLRVIKIDADTSRVTFQAGATVSELNQFLWMRDLSLSVVGNSVDQTYAGACQTGTQGSSIKFGSLASVITSFQMVNGEGKLIKASEQENKDVFDSARVGLGAIGILVEVTIQCEEKFYLQRKIDSMSTSKLLKDVDNQVNHAYHTFWWNPDRDEVITFTYDKVGKPNVLPDQRIASVIKYVLAFVSDKFMLLAAKATLLNALIMTVLFEAVKRQKALSDIGYNLLSHSFRNSSAFAECEYSVPRTRAEEVLVAIKKLLRKGYGCNFPITIRFVKDDNIWLSPSYQREVMVITFAMVYKQESFNQFSVELDELMKQFEGRPNWGKYHTLKHQDLKRVYPQLDNFEAVRNRMDPNGVFLNPYLKDCLLQ